MNDITTRKGLLIRDGQVIPLPEADSVAIAHGFHCAEAMVRDLEAKQTFIPDLDNSIAKLERIHHNEPVRAGQLLAALKEIKRLRGELAKQTEATFRAMEHS